MKRIVFDLDGTLTLDSSDPDYALRHPRPHMCELLKSYKEQGFTIVIASSRNMRSYDNAIGVITAKTLPVIFAWLEKHDIPYDEVFVGKPWCGEEGFYVDDKAIRPSEFRDFTYAEIGELLAREHDLALVECGG